MVRQLDVVEFSLLAKAIPTLPNHCRSREKKNSEILLNRTSFVRSMIQFVVLLRRGVVIVFSPPSCP